VNFLADDAQTLLTQVSRCREALGMPAI